MRQSGKKIIYTDLDGTILDEKNYSFLESLHARLTATLPPYPKKHSFLHGGAPPINQWEPTPAP